MLLAFTPEQRAKIHNAVAGERMAELRFMLAKNNTVGIRIALQGVSDNFEAASEDVADAKLTGLNIDQLAKTINDSIKEKQKVLSVLGEQATGEIRVRVLASLEVLREVKMKVEKNLPADLLVNETIDDLNLQIGDNIASASLSATEINQAVNVLFELSTQSAGKEASSQAARIKILISEFQKASISLQKEIPVTVKSAKK